MRLPSLAHLRDALVAVARRFPLPLLAAVAGTVVLLRAIETGDGADILAPLALGIPLFLALRLAGESGLYSRRVEVLLALVVGAGLVLLHDQWSDWGERLRFVRYAQLFVGAHMLVAVAPFVRDGTGFRPFNRQLLLRVLEGALQVAVIFAGISAALLAVDQLFPVSISGDAYQRLAVVLGFLYFPVHVLSGIEREAPDRDPRPLRVIGQYILVPLSALYLLILTAYLGQVLLTRSWPSGWIGWLVSWMAVAGTLSILLVRPARRDELPWAWAWERIFWILMLPAAAMLLVAVGKRVAQYGVTAPRYMALALGAWLAAMAVSYGLARVRDLRLVPASLAAVLLFTVAGPWGAAAVARESQMDRLTSLLEAEDMLEDGRAVPAEGAVDPLHGQEIMETLHYLLDTHRDLDLSGLLGNLGDAELAAGTPASGRETPMGVAAGRRGHSWSARLRAEAVATALGIDLAAGPMGPRDLRAPRSVALRAGDGIPVAGFDRIVVADEGATVRVADRLFRVELDGETGQVALVGEAGARIEFDLGPLVEVARSEAPDPGLSEPGGFPRIARSAAELSIDPSPPGPTPALPEGVAVRLVVRELVLAPGPGGTRDVGGRVMSLSASWLVSDGSQGQR
jgi:hypothetical protein